MAFKDDNLILLTGATGYIGGLLLTPWLSSLWPALVTPLYARVGRQLIEGVRNETTVQGMSARKSFTIRPMRIVEAIERAMNNED
jgi:hypothetical protein